jgi:hypothetical protein
MWSITRRHMAQKIICACKIQCREAEVAKGVEQRARPKDPRAAPGGATGITQRAWRGTDLGSLGRAPSFRVHCASRSRPPGRRGLSAPHARRSYYHGDAGTYDLRAPVRRPTLAQSRRESTDWATSVHPSGGRSERPLRLLLYRVFYSTARSSPPAHRVAVTMSVGRAFVSTEVGVVTIKHL